MAVLTVDVGGTPISLDCQRGGHASPRRVGIKTIGESGTEESSVRAELMVVPIVTVPISLATAAALRTLFAIGNQVPCSGDIFNKPGTITCSGTITDELRKTGDSVILSLTLYEIGTELAYTPPPEVYLTNLADDDTGAFRKAWTTLEGGFANSVGLRILNAATLTTCGTLPDTSLNCAVTFTDPDTPEVSWLSTAFLADGWLTGAPSLVFNSKGGTGDKWQTQTVKARVSLLRGATIIGTVDTVYAASNGDFSGGQISMAATTSLVLAGLIGDRVKVDLLGRIGLHGGYTDGNDGTSDLNRQTVTYGYTGAGDYYSKLSWGELAYLLDPTLRP